MFPLDSLSGIAIFVVTARSASFTEAAERLNVSKSAVGKSIARLEQRLGVKLFHRTTRRLILSADGDAYYAACASALGEIAAAESGLEPRSHEPAGRLRIDMASAFGWRVMLQILLETSYQFPGLQLRFKGSLQHLMFMTQVVDLSVLLLMISIPGFYAVCNLVRLRRHQVPAVCIG